MKSASSFIRRRRFLAVALGAVALTSLSSVARAGGGYDAGITSAPFGTLKDGRGTHLYTLTNIQGASAQITDFGAILVSLKMPDRNGALGDVVMGMDNAEAYRTHSPYFGATAGRYANRIAKGRFTLDGQTYKLATNYGPNHLHGGVVGFDKKMWTAHPMMKDGAPTLELTMYSPDGEEGYPGTLRTKLIYTLTNDNKLRLDYSAVTDKPTVLNLTHHSYFNLYGPGLSTILDHRVMINANRFTPTDATAIPFGELRSVRGTPFDFRTPHTIGERINQNDQQLKWGKGYDHNFVLNKPRPGALTLAARVSEPRSGRVMTVYTTEPGIQLYTGNFLDGVKGKYGRTYAYRGALCLETQHFPDSPNHANFPSTVLRPGHTYRQTTMYAFSTR